MHIAIYGRTIESKWKSKLCHVLDWLVANGAKLTYFDPFYLFLQKHLDGKLPPAPTFDIFTGLPDQCTLLLNLGGDGTFLESLVFIKDKKIPVAGINFGRLGFLAGGGSDPFEYCLEQLVQGSYQIEERTLLEVSSSTLPASFFPFALNDCAIQRKGSCMISVEVRLQAGQLPAYWADGLIVATPTGSTAYSLSVGGPIVLPNSQALIVAPIAPHNLNVRPMVIPDSEELTIVVRSRTEKAILTLDNRSITIPSGSEIKVRKAPFVLSYVSFIGEHFISILHEKLLWGFDKRNRKM
ncbi:MAG: NAD(+)/NADH kinase [Prevotellaceae bacterium]|jgi:NAD+ kinase|nr:NAD(+)/NADH kinase [Prevotellaceae bacterium]